MKGLQAKGLEIYAAYGNTSTDVKAYQEAGIPKSRTWIMGPHGGEGDTQKVPYWDTCGYHVHINDIFKHPDSSIVVPYVSLDWGGALWGYDI